MAYRAPSTRATTNAGRKSGGPPGTSSPITPDMSHDEARRISANAEGAVKTLTEGKSWLRASSWTLTDEDESLERLATILLAISMGAGIDTRAANTVRAVALMIAESDIATRASDIGSRVEETIKAAVSAAISTIEEKLTPQITFLKSITQDTAGALVKMNETINNQTTATTQLIDIDTQLKATTSTMSEHIKSYKNALTDAPTPAESRHTQTTARQNTPSLTLEDIALRNREATKSKQVLITFDPDGDVETAELKVTPTGAWSKIIADTLATIPITPSQTTASAMPMNMKIRGTTALRNGDLLLEFQDTEAAEWFRISRSSVLVLEALGYRAKIKERQYPVMIQFVPVEFDPTSEETLRNLEVTNNAVPLSYASAKWIKNPSARARGQATAHLRLMTNSPEAANKMILESIYILDKKVSAKKPSKEPMRCMKCLRFGHETRVCKSNHAFCTHCAGAHAFAECQARHQNPRCANCHSEHPSNSRDCPEFRQKCAAMDAKCPDNLIPFYPTSEEWTWARNFEKLSPYAPSDWPPARTAKPRRGGQQNYRQTTLNLTPASGSNATNIITPRYEY